MIILCVLIWGLPFYILNLSNSNEDNYAYITITNDDWINVSDFTMMDKYTKNMVGIDMGKRDIVLNSCMILNNKILITLPIENTKNYQIIVRRP